MPKTYYGSGSDPRPSALNPVLDDLRHAKNAVIVSYEKLPKPRHLAFFVPLALVPIFAWGMTVTRGSIEDSLRDDAQSALTAVGAPGLNVDVNGRDVTVSGTLPDTVSRSQAVQAVDGVTGVRTANVGDITGGKAEVTPVTTPAPTTAAPTTVAGTVAPSTVAATVAPTAAPTIPVTTAAPATTPTTSKPLAPTTTFVPPQTLDDLAKLPTIEFDMLSATLTPEGTTLVDSVAKVLAKYPTVKIRIEGNTDTNGTRANNQILSEQRAETVRAALVARGIDAKRLTTLGNGQDKPIATNATPEGRQRNRRTEFIVVK